MPVVDKEGSIQLVLKLLSLDQGCLNRQGRGPHPRGAGQDGERRATYGGQKHAIVLLSLAFNRPLHFQSILLNAGLIAFQ